MWVLCVCVCYHFEYPIYVCFLHYLLGLFKITFNRIFLSGCNFFLFKLSFKCCENYEMFPKPTTSYQSILLMCDGWYSIDIISMFCWMSNLESLCVLSINIHLLDTHTNSNDLKLRGTLNTRFILNFWSKSKGTFSLCVFFFCLYFHVFIFFFHLYKGRRERYFLELVTFNFETDLMYNLKIDENSIRSLWHFFLWIYFRPRKKTFRECIALLETLPVCFFELKTVWALKGWMVEKN